MERPASEFHERRSRMGRRLRSQALHRATERLMQTPHRFRSKPQLRTQRGLDVEMHHGAQFRRAANLTAR
jgi:hypothetical protein